ncbi:hypothetical protein K474DRAFT_1701943 [Panus rudis PR-1116 ss-1]|nr:hypothetical protein K474DRAFT_1701943 [Panus rudis PR-1116 ss-1]
MPPKHQKSIAGLGTPQRTDKWVVYQAPETPRPPPHAAEENHSTASSSTLPFNTGSQTPSQRTPRKKAESDQEKLDSIISFIRGKYWSLGKFLYLLFREKDEDGTSVWQSQSPSHRGFVCSFLQGNSQYTAGEIVELLYEHRDSKPASSHHKSKEMFSTTLDTKNICYAQPALSCWATYLVASQVIRESNRLISPGSGLRVRASRRKSEPQSNGGLRADSNAPLPEADNLPTLSMMQHGQSHTSSNASASGLRLGGDAQVVRAEDSDYDGDVDDEMDLDGGQLSENNAGNKQPKGGDITAEGVPAISYGRPDSDASGGSKDSNAENSGRTTTGTAQAVLQSGVRQRKRRGQTHDPLVTWDQIEKFSFESLTKRFQEDAPVLYYLLMKFMRPAMEDVTNFAADAIYRPKHIVCASVMSELVYARNQWVNLFPLCRSISMVAMKAHNSMYRTGSHLAQCTAYDTARNALVEMAEAKRHWLQHNDEKHELIVMDNVQYHMKHQEHFIGQKDEMVIGCAATAVELEDCEKDAFNLAAYQARVAENRRSELTVQKLYDDLDWDHVDVITELHILQSL